MTTPTLNHLVCLGKIPRRNSRRARAATCVCTCSSESSPNLSYEPRIHSMQTGPTRTTPHSSIPRHVDRANRSSCDVFSRCCEHNHRSFDRAAPGDGESGRLALARQPSPQHDVYTCRPASVTCECWSDVLNHRRTVDRCLCHCCSS